jgi:CBS domain containing-hemolysin-like protein
MTSTLWAVAILAGLAVTALASIGAKVLRHFSHRRLEVYCRARRRRDLFSQILAYHDDVALTVEKLQMAALVLLTGCVALGPARNWLEQSPLAAGAAAAGYLLAVMAVTVWIPWAVARHRSAHFLLQTWWLWKLVHRLFLPLHFGVPLFDMLVRRLAGLPKQADRETEEEAFEDEIMAMVTVGQRDGLLEADAREMIEGVMELGDADVADIMTPRREVDALEVHWDWPEIIDYLIHCGRTRLPVYDGSLDNIVGVLYVKDLLPELVQGPDQPRRSLRELARPAWFIPSTIPLDDLLQDFRENRKHLAIVVDEYEAVEGVVTIEDVLEEIVGEIVDEFDKEEDAGIRELDEGKSEVLGSVHLDTINERLGLNLPESDDFETIAGLVTERLKRIPKTGDRIECNGVLITVREANPRYVARVSLELIEPRHDAAVPDPSSSTHS